MDYEILQLQRDDESIRNWVARYKDFRLLSLKTAPEAFGSTCARELAFTDEVWNDRMANPKATTFFALQSDRIVCSLTLMGPLPCTPQESSPFGNPWTTLSGESAKDLPLHYRVNGMFTLPEARGKGLAQSLLERSIAFGAGEATRSGLDFAFSIAVNADNTPARNLHEKCGFKNIKEETILLGRPRVVILMEYTPEPRMIN